MSFEHLPNGKFKNTLQRNNGAFPLMHQIEKMDLQTEFGSARPSKIQNGVLFEFIQMLGKFWDIPTPNLYRLNSSTVNAVIVPFSCSIVIACPYNVMSTEYIKSLIAHEFQHGLQNENILFQSSEKDPLKESEFAKLCEFQADLNGAAFTSDEILIRGHEQYADELEGETHPSRAERIKNIIEARKSPEWATWLERRDRESLTELLKLPFERA